MKKKVQKNYTEIENYVLKTLHNKNNEKITKKLIEQVDQPGSIKNMICLLGDNGSGKTTLLKKLRDNTGNIFIGARTRYFSTQAGFGLTILKYSEHERMLDAVLEGFFSGNIKAGKPELEKISLGPRVNMNLLDSIHTLKTIEASEYDVIVPLLLNSTRTQYDKITINQYKETMSWCKKNQNNPLGVRLLLNLLKSFTTQYRYETLQCSEEEQIMTLKEINEIYKIINTREMSEIEEIYKGINYSQNTKYAKIKEYAQKIKERALDMDHLYNTKQSSFINLSLLKDCTNKEDIDKIGTLCNKYINNKKIMNLLSKLKFHRTINLNGEIISLNKLSSGEQNIITTFCHILKSISLKVSKKITLLIDEPDLHLHLSWQKKYIKKLIKIINTVPRKDIYIIIATHSPFIVSDFTQNNTLILKKHNNTHTIKHTNSNMFGANYVNIVRNGFFFDEGEHLMGSFAESVIGKMAENERQHIINNHDLDQDHKTIKAMIGDDFLKNNLLYFKSKQ